MNTWDSKWRGWRVVLASLAWLCTASEATAIVDGVPGPNFNLTAKADYITLGDGDSLLAWGYANGAGPMQYPGVDPDRQPGRYGDRESEKQAAGPGLDRVPGTAGRDHFGRCARGLLTCGGATGQRRDPGDLHLHRHARRHLSLSQRHTAGSAGRDGAGRRADRAAPASPNQAYAPPEQRLRPRVSVPADRDGSDHPLRWSTAGTHAAGGHQRVPPGVLVHQRPQRTGYHVRRARRRGCRRSPTTACRACTPASGC